MKIYTGYYNKIKEYKLKGLIVISISRYTPDFVNTDYNYIDIAPTKDILFKYKNSKESDDIKEKEYIQQYKKHIEKEIDDFIHFLYKQTDKDIVLVCYEHPFDFCHRHILAEVLEKELNTEIKECFYEDYKRINYRIKPFSNIANIDLEEF